jgi:hypothetical protein
MKLGALRRTGRETKVEAPAWKLRLLILVLLAFAVGSAALAVFATDAGIWRRIMFAFGALVFAFVAFVGFSWSQGGINSLVSITDDGLELPVGFLYWDDIERVDFTSVAGSHALGIWTHDPFVLARRGHHWWLWVLAFMAWIQRGPQISYTEFTAPIGELYAAIETRRNPTATSPASHAGGSVSASSDGGVYDSVTTRGQPASGGESRRDTRTTR